MKNNTNTIKYSLLGIIVLISFCCKKDDNPIQPPLNEVKLLVPLADGNIWTYKITTYNSDGSISWIDTIDYSIKKDTTVNGVTWKLLSEMQWGYRNDSLGFHETNWEHADYTYLYPAKVGDQMGSFMVVSIDTVINTPIGNLHCYKYQINWFGFPLNTLIAPQLGIVKIESSAAGTNFISQVHDLIQYKLN